MDLEKILNCVLNLNPNDVRSFCYSNINGEESLKINGEEILDKYDDSELLSFISKCKEILDSLDDCTFEDVVNDLKNDEDIKELNEIFEKDHFTKEESDEVYRKVYRIHDAIRIAVASKRDYLNKILEQL